MYEEVEVEIDDLLLDQQNPRMGATASQAEALSSLIGLNVRNFANMMDSVKGNGLDPGDLFYLVDESDQTGVEGFTVLDGNRRVAALKVLRQPTLLAGAQLADKVAKRLRDRTEDFDPAVIGESRTCVLFDSREDAEDWIARRHGTGLEGEQRISWGPLDIQRFLGDRSLLDIFGFVERNGGYSKEEWSVLRTKLDRRSTTVRRFIDSKIGTSVLGIGSEEVGGVDLPTTTRGPAFLVRILKRLLEDAADRVIDSRRFNKAWQIEEYFDDLPDDMHPESDKGGGKPQRFSTLNLPPKPGTSKPKPSQATPPPTTTSSTGRLRDTLCPKTVEFNQPTNAKGQQFMREATRTKLKEYPLSAAFLLRGFIQFVVDSYMNENGLPFWEGTKQLDLSVRADRVIDHLVTNKKAKRGDLSGLKRRLSEKASKHPSSIQALNDYHHDQYQVPSPDALRSGWDDATALFVAVLGRAGK